MRPLLNRLLPYQGNVGGVLNMSGSRPDVPPQFQACCRMLYLADAALRYLLRPPLQIPGLHANVGGLLVLNADKDLVLFDGVADFVGLMMPLFLLDVIDVVCNCFGVWNITSP